MVNLGHMHRKDQDDSLPLRPLSEPLAQAQTRSSASISSAHFSPMISATEAVLLPTLAGQIDRSEISAEL